MKLSPYSILQFRSFLNRDKRYSQDYIMVRLWRIFICKSNRWRLKRLLSIKNEDK